jgi:hypothetical protein
MREVVATLAGITGALIAGGAFNIGVLALAMWLFDPLSASNAGGRRDLLFAACVSVGVLVWPAATVAAAAGEWLRRRWGGAARPEPPSAGLLRGAVAYLVGVTAGLLAAWLAVHPMVVGALSLVMLAAGAPTAGLLAARAVLRGRSRSAPGPATGVRA